MITINYYLQKAIMSLIGNILWFILGGAIMGHLARRCSP